MEQKEPVANYQIEEINEILQPFIKIPSKTKEIKNQSIYVSSKKGVI